jgi:hypothetical protein
MVWICTFQPPDSATPGNPPLQPTDPLAPPTDAQLGQGAPQVVPPADAKGAKNVDTPAPPTATAALPTPAPQSGATPAAPAPESGAATAKVEPTIPEKK